MPLQIEFDAYDPTDDERKVAIENVREALPLLTEQWEQKARSSAASDIMEAVHSQSDESFNKDDVGLLTKEMQITALHFTYVDDEHAVFPSLSYSCPKSFPDMMLCIQFATDLTVEEVTLNETPT